MTCNSLKFSSAIVAGALLLTACAEQTKPSIPPVDEVMELADNYLAARLRVNPTLAYFAGYTLEHHDGYSDNSPAALSAWQGEEDAFLTRLEEIDADALHGTGQWILLGQMREELEASIGTRVCRRELWSINHMGGGIQNAMPRLAPRQPVGTPTARTEAIGRWHKIAAFILQDIENLKEGVRLGYLAPKSATRRVISQVDGFLALSSDESPLYDPIRRDDDADFAAALSAVIEGEIIPAMESYRAYLAEAYVDQARESRAVSSNPDGRACWEASYRKYTTLTRTAEEVHALGQETVDRYMAEVTAMGQELYKIDGFEETVAHVMDDPDNRFKSAEEMHTLFEEVVARSQAAMGQAFAKVPEHVVEVRPYPDFLAGTGLSARYERGVGDEPSIFRYDPTTWVDARRGLAERTAVHEAYPGHHMQFAFIRDLEEVHPFQRSSFNSAFGEGWARYSEALTEELGLYLSDAARIQRRAWPARGMVVDSGLHVLGWSDEEATAYLMQSGGYTPDRATQMLDRISVIPAQLTAYDSGAIEIFALRAAAEEAFGDAFDIREFHNHLLEAGVTPMWMLRQRMETWYAQERAE